jgi:hypothetical protein
MPGLRARGAPLDSALLVLLSLAQADALCLLPDLAWVALAALQAGLDSERELALEVTLHYI